MNPQRLIVGAFLLAALATCTAHAEPILTAPDGTEYVEHCPDGLEDVACFDAVTRS